ncbi:MAG: twitching motility protein PilT [Gammaproteobacteria bacterium]|nr:MAG: twitching motility protein PilT [Gammaproteobacteria bacterium]
MASIDTNVLVRFLINDDPEQFDMARNVIDAARKSSGLFICTSVILELEWVLRSRYALSKQEFIQVIIQLLETRELLFESEAILERALSLYQESNIDFADCIHVAVAMTHDQTPMYTFDRKASRTNGFSLPDVQQE